MSHGTALPNDCETPVDMEFCHFHPDEGQLSGVWSIVRSMNITGHLEQFSFAGPATTQSNACQDNAIKCSGNNLLICKNALLQKEIFEHLVCHEVPVGRLAPPVSAQRSLERVQWLIIADGGRELRLSRARASGGATPFGIVGGHKKVI